MDVEEYFHPTALSSAYPSDSWESLPRRSPAVVDRLLEFMDTHSVIGTFFVLGWLAKREPEMVRRISQQGHEIASHGFEHALIGRLGRAGFRESVARSKAVLERVCHSEVRGYRAPSFSLVPGLEWAWDVLLEEGYSYDSSLFPVTQHPTYGYPGADRYPHWIKRNAGQLVEVPATTAQVLGATFPAAGGAYFRLFPYALVRSGIRQAGLKGEPGTFYIHPWELDHWSPRAGISWVARLRTFGGRSRIWSRLEKLVKEFRFRSVGETVDEMIAGVR